MVLKACKANNKARNIQNLTKFTRGHRAHKLTKLETVLGLWLILSHPFLPFYIFKEAKTHALYIAVLCTSQMHCKILYVGNVRSYCSLHIRRYRESTEAEWFRDWMYATVYELYRNISWTVSSTIKLQNSEQLPTNRKKYREENEFFCICA